MPGIIRKFVIFAIADGLILQPYGGHYEKPPALRLEWNTARLTAWNNTTADEYRARPHVESHGIVGVLSIASYSFLISITRREQAAQILGKPVYMIKDISIFPLSSQADAERAIEQANEIVKKERDASLDTDTSEDDSEGYESLEDRDESNELPSEAKKKLGHSKKQSSIAEDVISRRGQYGRFAAQWFSRAGWSQERKRTLGMSTEDINRINHSPVVEKEQAAEPQPGEADTEAAAPPETEIHRATNAFELMPKLLKTTKALLNSNSFFFSYDVNITRRLGLNSPLWSRPPTRETVDPLYFWNHNLVAPFADAGHHSFYIPVMQGFVGQRSFIAKPEKSGSKQTAAVESLDKILRADRRFRNGASKSGLDSMPPQPFILTVISRRSVQRAGLRYLRRGVDDSGSTANAVETEQILSSPIWDEAIPIRSFLQVRGSIPLYFSQSPYAFKPVPVLHQSQEANQSAFKRHFDDLHQKYGDVQIAVLVDKHGSEVKIGEEFEAYTRRYNEEHSGQPLAFEWFDFHAECRGMKFENVKLLIDKMEATLKAHSETIIKEKTATQKQSGIIRTNCMDCLDRTNVVQSAFGQYMLEQELRDQGFEIDFQSDSSTQWFNSLWADNGDAISRQYAGTAALKGDFTRTRKRNYRGALNDFSLTLSRYYNNIVNDYFSQIVIDYLLGNVTIQAFEDFESDMMSTDPGVSIDKIREKAIETCSKIVIQNEGEDLIQGWTMLSPNLPNTLRSLPFSESVLLLTDRAVYSCRFNWNTEKVGSFERVELGSVTNIRYGTYVTSSITDAQLNETRNVGLVITYNPTRGNIIRVNTRSLQNSMEPEKDDSVAGKSSEPEASSKQGKTDNEGTRFLAFKAILPRSMSVINGPTLTERMEQIASEIKRAAVNEAPQNENHLGMEQIPIISAADARKRTSYLEQLGHQVKRLVWA